MPLLQDLYASALRGECPHPQLRTQRVHGLLLQLARQVWSLPLSRLHVLDFRCVYTDDRSLTAASRLFVAHTLSLRDLLVRLWWSPHLARGAAALNMVLHGVPSLPSLIHLVLGGCIDALLGTRMAALAPGLRALDLEGGILSGALEAWSLPSFAFLRDNSLVYRADVPRAFPPDEFQQFFRSRVLHHLTLMPPEAGPAEDRSMHSTRAIGGCALPPVAMEFVGDSMYWTPSPFYCHALGMLVHVPHAWEFRNVKIALPDDIHSDVLRLFRHLPRLTAL